MLYTFEMETITCPGCGVELPVKNLPESDMFNASGECWEKYIELSASTTILYDRDFIHQTAIDTYEAQHGGGKTKPIAVVFGLAGLYLRLEKDYPVQVIQKIHMKLARKTREWPRLVPPTHHFEKTVVDALQANSDIERRAKILAWANATWDAWKRDHGTLRDIVDKNLLKN